MGMADIDILRTRKYNAFTKVIDNLHLVANDQARPIVVIAIVSCHVRCCHGGLRHDGDTYQVALSWWAPGGFRHGGGPSNHCKKARIYHMYQS